MLDEPLGDRLGALQTSLLEATDVQGVATAVAESAASTLPGAVAASVTLRRHGHATTVGASDARALRCDEAEYAEGAGPCLAAADWGRTVVVQDVTREERWPVWRQAATAEGFGGAAAFPVGSGDDVTVSLNVYCAGPVDWSDATVVLGERYAAEISRVLAWSVRLADLSTTTADLRAALESRAAIDQAIGVVMAQNRCGPDDALELLRRASQRQNVKLRDLAHDVVLRVGGEEPSTTFAARG